MPKKTQFKEGYVSGKQLPNGRWQLRWWETNAERYVRRTVPTTSYAEAVSIAREFNSGLAADSGFLPSMRKLNGPGVNAAIKEMIENADANAATKHDYASRGNQFLAWLARTHPGVDRWADLTPKIAQDYLRACEREGLAHDSIRLRLFVVRATSLYMSRTYPAQYAHITQSLRLKRPHPDLSERASRRALSAGNIRFLLEFLEQRRPGLYPIACLQSLAGLRLREATYLREQDVDFQRGTVRVAETPCHRPKTRYSHRVVPVVPRVLDAIRNALRSLKVRHPHGYLFLARAGQEWHKASIEHAMKKALLVCWQETGIEAFRDFQPHHLRATFATLVRKQRVDHRIVQAYLGQAPTDILGMHYEVIDVERMAAEVLPAVEAILTGKTDDDLHQTYIAAVSVGGTTGIQVQENQWRARRDSNPRPAD